VVSWIVKNVVPTAYTERILGAWRLTWFVAFTDFEEAARIAIVPARLSCKNVKPPGRVLLADVAEGHVFDNFVKFV